MLKYLLFLGSLITHTIAVAQCHCGSSGSSCLNSVSDGSLNNSSKIKLELSSEYRLFSEHETNGHSHGTTHTHNTATAEEVTIKHMQMSQLNFSIAMNKRWNALFSLPYFNLTTSNHSHVNSFGDLILGFIVKPFKYNLYFTAGTKLPSGKNINTFGDNLSLVGTGSIDPIGSIILNLPLKDKFNISQQLFFRKSFKGYNSTNQGNILSYQGNVFYNLFSKEDSIGNDYIKINIGSGLWYENYGKQIYNNVVQQNSGGSAILSPIVFQVYYKKWAGNVNFTQPLYQHYHSEQVNQLQRFRITLNRYF